MTSLMRIWRPTTDSNDKSDDTVGYKKPPRHAQFKPGQSGNSKGRPKPSATFADVLQKQLRKNVTVTLGKKVQKVSMLEMIAAIHAQAADERVPRRSIDVGQTETE